MPQTQTMVSLLQSVNVSGKNQIKMAEQNPALANAGLMNPAAYIQSGNAMIEVSLRRQIRQ